MLLPSHLAFAAPELLGFLVVLPVIWLLLRLTPPAPKKVRFPALALLEGLVTLEETPARTPWWLLLLRFLIAALLILAFARPQLGPLPVVVSKGTLLIAVDNDWAAASHWDIRQHMLDHFILQARDNGQTVILLPTTPNANGDPLTLIGPVAPEAARADAARLKPQPWGADWQHANALLQNTDMSAVSSAVWLTSGLGNVDAKIFYDSLKRVNVRAFGDPNPLYLLAPPRMEEDQLVLPLMRAVTDNAASLFLDAVARDGNVLARLDASFTPGSPRTLVPLNLPLEIRNQVVRFEVEGQRSAGTTALLDASWEHRPVGLAGEKGELAQHSLLNGLFYIDRALLPFADLHVDKIESLVAQNMAVLIVTDDTDFSDDDIKALMAWIKKGGILVRFAGPRLAAANDARESDLMPVTLRTGDRALGGTLSWATPQKLRAFPSGSPFKGLPLPVDVTVSRQVLAEPDGDLPSRTWAALDDGTPLVTAKNIGQGTSVLFHVPARSDWSNLPLSGLFVDMLRRIVDLSRGGAPDAASLQTLPPLRMLDAFAEEQKPGPLVEPVDDADFTRLSVGPHHPPGLYGREALNRAFNLGSALGQPQALTGVPLESLTPLDSHLDWQSRLLALAFLLLLIDFVISLRMRGVLVWRGLS